MIVHETDHLAVDELDTVWLTRYGAEEGTVCLGYLVEGMEWPSVALYVEPGKMIEAPEPNWWLTEIGELYDKWTDGARFARDCRDEVDEAFRRKER